MKVGQFSYSSDEGLWVGVLTTDETVVNIHRVGYEIGIDVPRTTTDLFSTWGWQQKVELVTEYAEQTGAGTSDINDLVRHAPVTDPQKIVCVGLNYVDHAKESGTPVPDEPVLFAKFQTAITAPESPIMWDPKFANNVDYEAELAIVIGEETRHVSQPDAREHIAGYTIGNDISARDIQHGDGQWIRGKSLDTFAPLGPHILTTDELEDPHGLHIWTEVNGERVQDSSTSNFIFGVDEIVSICSQAFTLTPGDVIFTGTPPGVGIYREPQTLLEAGDIVTVGIEGIGELTNSCNYL